MTKKIASPPLGVFMTFDQAEIEIGIPVWKIRKWTWGDKPLLPSYHVDGPRGRTYVKRAELLALMESGRKA